MALFIKWYFLFSIFFVMYPNTPVMAQQERDSVLIAPKFSVDNKTTYQFDASFYSHYPLSGEMNVENRLLNQFFSYDSNVLDQYRYYFTSENYFYQYSNNGYRFWQNGNPLEMGIRFSLKEALDWDKLDLFFDADGLVINFYEPDESGKPINMGNGVLWNAGVGVGYKISPGKTIFLKSTFSSKNFIPIGSQHVGGVNVKF